MRTLRIKPASLRIAKAQTQLRKLKKIIEIRRQRLKNHTKEMKHEYTTGCGKGGGEGEKEGGGVMGEVRGGRGWRVDYRV